MTDTLLTVPDQKEGLSLVYAKALATKDEPCWMTVTTEHLVLRRRAYWLSLQHGHAEVVGQQGVTVRIPERNVFDVETLRGLTEQSRSGEI